MKWILAASLITLLFCSGSVAYAQGGTAEQGLTATSDPSTPVQRMTPQQREQFVMASKSADPGVTPDQLKDFKNAYESMTESQQIQLATDLVKQIQQPLKQIQQQTQPDSQIKLQLKGAVVPEEPATTSTQSGSTGQ